MLQLEQSAILRTSIKLPFSIKTLVLSIFKWPLNTSVTNQVLYLVYRRNLAIIRFITDNFQQYNFIILHIYSTIYTANIKKQFGLKIVLCVAVHKSTHNHNLFRCHTPSIVDLHYTSSLLIVKMFPSYVYQHKMLCSTTTLDKTPRLNNHTLM